MLCQRSCSPRKRNEPLHERPLPPSENQQFSVLSAPHPQKEQKKSEDLIKLGYNVFSRDTKSDIYKIENITEYFVYNNNIYIIFAYGNDRMTSEKDIVII